MKLFRILAAAAVLVAGLAVPAFAGVETNTSSGLTVQGAPLAVHGHDTVAFFTEGRPVLGTAEHAHVYKGATYRFSSAGNLEKFKQDPEAYVPQFGGYCAYGVAVGAKFDGDPRYWKIVDGKLYLNLNRDIQATWEKDIPGNIGKAGANWTKIVNKAPSELK